MRRGAKRPRFSVGGHPVSENDDSSNHSGLGILDYDENSLSQQPDNSTNSSDQHHFPQNQYVPDRSRRVQRSSIKPSNGETSNLTACLDHLFNVLSRKDKEGFFQYPVTDQLAPGYFQIITHPMDFSTIRKKINQDEYSTILEFRQDFDLMCENAMKYNRPETIYWQAAKKLSTSGSKLMSKEKLTGLRRTLDSFGHLTEREFGFSLESNQQTNDEQSLNANEPMETTLNENDTTNNSNSVPRPPKVVLKLPRYYEKLPNLLAEEEEEEEASPEEILSQAQNAAQCPREKLSLRRPAAAYTFSCQRTNGATSLRFLNQDDLHHQQQSQTRVISIGELSNLPSSAGAPLSSAYHPNPTPIVNESEKRNHLLPRYYLDYGPFSTHAPQYDSSFTSIAADDLDLLIHTYGSEFAAQHPVSTIDYVKDSGDLALSYIDRFLSSSTNGINGTSSKQQKQKVQINGHGETDLNTNVGSNGTSHDSSKSRHLHDNTRQQLDLKLDETAKLLMQLRQAQNDRLCQPSNKIHQIISTQSQPTNESLNEYELAEKVLMNLNDMLHQSYNGPEPVIVPETIRYNLGVNVNDESSTTAIVETL